MKLIVTTQYRENYGDEMNPYWKEKFGSTYVFKNIELDENAKVVGIEDMESKCEFSNPMAVESVLVWYVASDDEALDVEDYELPSVIYYELVDGEWTGYKINDTRIADSFLREGIVTMEEFWVENADGSRKNYRQKFTMDDGSILNSQDELSDWYSVVYTKRFAPDVPVL